MPRKTKTKCAFESLNAIAGDSKVLRQARIKAFQYFIDCDAEIIGSESNPALITYQRIAGAAALVTLAMGSMLAAQRDDNVIPDVEDSFDHIIAMVRNDAMRLLESLVENEGKDIPEAPEFSTSHS
jgi:hypothetical protein